jgi:peptidoglycan-associated lipoprotein
MLLMAAVACHKKTPPIARPVPPPPPASTPATRPPAPPEPVAEPPIVPPEPVREDAIASASLDDLNRNSPLKPVFFALDSDELTPEGQKTLDENASVLKKYSTWTVTIEGHCDERGTAEYNLALGERRAVAARAYLVSLGISADRLRTVSYGKEFPFDPGHDEAAYSKNRRAHFVVTAK